MSDEFIVETFKASVPLSEKLTMASHRFDLTKSQIIRLALERLFTDLDQLGAVIEEAVVSSLVRNNTKGKR